MSYSTYSHLTPLLLVSALALSSSAGCGDKAASDSGDVSDTGESDPSDDGSGSESSTTGAPEGSCEALVGAGLTATGFPAACNPSELQAHEGYFCCSTDATTLSGGLGLFTEDNNFLSAHGQCIEDAIILSGQAGLANGCPVPCDPASSVAEVESVCGPSAVALCCQTAEVTVNDCIFDPGRSCFREVSGADIAPVDGCPEAQLQSDLAAAGYDTVLARCNTTWSNAAHDTHQDPGVAAADSACSLFAASGVIDFAECVGLLTVANRRGFCLSKSADVQVCPLTLPGYADACDTLNQDLGYSCE